MFNTNPKFKATAEAQLHIAKIIEQTCTKSAISVHVFSKLGDVCVYTGPLNLKSEFPATQSCQLLAFEYCSLKSNKLFKNNVAAHSCSDRGHMLEMQRYKKKTEQEFVVGRKVLENILSLYS